MSMGVIYRCEIKQHGYFKTTECPVCKMKAELCNHRTLLKIMANPVLRLFGWEIASLFTADTDQFIKYQMRRSK